MANRNSVLEGISLLPADIQRRIILEVADLTQTVEEKYKFALQLANACEKLKLNICSIKDINRNIWALLYKHDISDKLPFNKNSQVVYLKDKYLFTLESLMKRKRLVDRLMLAKGFGYEKMENLLLKLATPDDLERYEYRLLRIREAQREGKKVSEIEAMLLGI